MSRLALLVCVLAVSAGVAAVAVAPADAATRRAGIKPRVLPPKVKCASAARARSVRRRATLRICARLGSGRVVGRAGVQQAGLPAALTVPATFAPASLTPGGPPAPAPVPTPDAPSLPPIYSNPFAVQVQAFEFGFQLSKATVTAGNVRVEFNLSRAEDPHNLMLVRADGTGPLYDFDEQPSGAVVAKTLPLTAGRWTLFCSLPNHQASGMQATLTVAPG
jgi:plastocyanin